MQRPLRTLPQSPDMKGRTGSSYRTPSTGFLRSCSWVELDNETGVETQKESYRNVSDVVDDPSESFSVYDETGAEVATATYGEVAGLLYNLFFHVVAKTDA